MPFERGASRAMILVNRHGTSPHDRSRMNADSANTLNENTVLDDANRVSVGDRIRTAIRLRKDTAVED